MDSKFKSLETPDFTGISNANKPLKNRIFRFTFKRSVVRHHHTPPVNSRLRGLSVGAFFVFEALFEAQNDLEQVKTLCDGVRRQSI